MDLELSVIAVVDVLGGLDGAIVLESNMVTRVVLGDQHEVAVVLLNNELAPATTLSGVQVTTLVDAEVTSVVGNRLQLDVLGLVSRVQAVNLPGSGLAVATGGGDVVAIELQVLAGGDVLEVDFSVVTPGLKDHFSFFLMNTRKSVLRPKRKIWGGMSTSSWSEFLSHF